MSRITQVLAGMVLGVALFFAVAAMLVQSSGAKVFVYQGF
jgi:hypothetical protein